MKSKATLNRRKNKRRKKNKPSRAAEMAADIMEQRTLDSLDPVKNAANNKLFIFDSDLPHTNGAGDNKAIKNKTTHAERKLAHSGLGVVLPKTTQKSDKEKRKLTTLQKDTIEQKAKRIKTEEDKKMDVDEKNVLIKTVTSTATKKSYDLWANVPEPPKNPKQSFIEEVLHPKQKEFVHKPIESKLAAVVPNAGQSYRPVEEDQQVLKQKNKKMEAHLQASANERKIVLQKLSSYKHYFPRIDKRVHKDEYEEGEEPEQIRAMPEKHKTAKEAKKIQERKKRKQLEIREEEFNRTQRDIHRIDDILAGIEDEDKAKEERASKRQANKDLRFNQPFSTDGKKIKQRLITPVADAPQRLRNLTNSNPVHDQIASLKNRGLMSSIKPKTKHEKHFRLVEPREVIEMMREDEEKYLKPVLEKLKN